MSEECLAESPEYGVIRCRDECLLAAAAEHLHFYNLSRIIIIMTPEFKTLQQHVCLMP